MTEERRKAEIEDFLSTQLPDLVYLNRGSIVYQSLLEERAREMSIPLDIERLLTCVEDNIYTNDDGDERIDYANAIQDYLKETEE